MQVIEELLYQKTAQGLDWLFSVWWYWLPAGIGVLLFVFYEETAFFLLNYLVKEGAARYFGEAEDF